MENIIIGIIVFVVIIAGVITYSCKKADKVDPDDEDF